MGFIPFVNLYLCLVESFYIVKDAKIFSHVLIESPQTLAAKKLKVEQKKQELSEWEEF
jgi:hypothetical protein